MSRIVIAIETLLPGGAEKIMSSLANYLSEEGHEVIMVNGDRTSSFFKLNPKVRLIKLGLMERPVKAIFRVPYLIFLNIRKILWLLRYLSNNHVDAVLAIEYSMFIPCILVCKLTHTPVYSSVRCSNEAITGKIYRYYKFFLKYCDGVVFQSESVMNNVIFSAINRKCVIYNLLSSSDISPDIDGEVMINRNKIICVGRLVKEKNYQDIILAFSNISKEYELAKLYIYGDGPLKCELVEVISDYNLNNKVLLCGSEYDAIKDNNDSGLFVMNSIMEGFPNALIEAMANGIPCIITSFNQELIAHFVNDGENGFVVPVNDCRMLERTMRKVLEMSDEDLRCISVNARKIYDELNIERIGKQWVQFLEL